MTGFSIELDFVGGLNSEQRKVFELAAKRWQEVIQGAAAGGDAMTLVIRAQGQSIDGPGRVLGQAGPTHIRTSDRLPLKGIMQFDAADLQEMQSAGTLKDIILHEMGHVLGIGTLWETKGVLKGAGTKNPEYIGSNAMREYATLLNESTPRPIPVANTGGPGTAEGHWRETTFDYELMTGYAEDEGLMPLSRMTVAALEDLGYKVDYEKADPYKLPMRPALVGTAAAPPNPRVHHYCKTTFPKIETEKKGRWYCCGC